MYVQYVHTVFKTFTLQQISTLLRCSDDTQQPRIKKCVIQRRTDILRLEGEGEQNVSVYLLYIELGNGKWEIGNGKWEMGNGKMENGNTSMHL
jgi:hypothetical protein